MTKAVALKDYALSKSAEVKRIFDENYLRILQHQHKEVPMQYVVDFLHKAQLSGADPRTNQVYLNSYWSNKLGHKVGVTIFSYHFFLSQANRTGEYNGVNVDTKKEPVFDPVEGKDIEMLVSTATVHRKDKEPVTFKARWKEFYNSNNPMWKSKPYIMLEKTAISNALRWAFPEALSGMFIAEEIRDEHLAEAEKMMSIEVTEKKIEKEEKLLEKAKTSKQKAPIIEAIKLKAKELNMGKDVEEKFQWMKTELKVNNFDELKNLKVKELQEILEGISE